LTIDFFSFLFPLLSLFFGWLRLINLGYHPPSFVDASFGKPAYIPLFGARRCDPQINNDEKKTRHKSLVDKLSFRGPKERESSIYHALGRVMGADHREEKWVCWQGIFFL
jgi:hypothetical protein